MQPIIPPVKVELIEEELTKDKLLRKTNKGNNEIYIITYYDSPNTMMELGRLREYTFRYAGGGTGKSVDIDEYDTSENPYRQLIVWNPRNKEIVGGYRFILGNTVKLDENNQPKIATAKLFKMSDKFIKDYLPHSIELGRSFVQPKYQPSVDDKMGIFSLDNLWDGLGALLVEYPQIKYFFGKFTMYRQFDVTARDMILYFLEKYFPDKENLMRPHEPIKKHTDERLLYLLFKNLEYQEAYKYLLSSVKYLGEHLPPLVNAYMSLSSTMKTFGTAINKEFGDVEETGVMVCIEDIYESKKERHINSYLKYLKEKESENNLG